MTKEEMSDLKDIAEALQDASDHLDYCGYGDAWEREGAQAQGLPDKIDKALVLCKALGLLTRV